MLHNKDLLLQQTLFLLWAVSLTPALTPIILDRKLSQPCRAGWPTFINYSTSPHPETPFLLILKQTKRTSSISSLQSVPLIRLHSQISPPQSPLSGISLGARRSCRLLICIDCSRMVIEWGALRNHVGDHFLLLCCGYRSIHGG